MTQLQFGDMTLTWLESTRGIIDGGVNFGPVAYDIWKKKFPNVKNNIQLDYDPILIQYQGRNLLIDTGYETSKLSEKEMSIYGLQGETKLYESLASLNLTTEDIDTVLMTHMHHDHANGLTKLEEEEYVSVFPNAKIFLTEKEWENVTHPNPRTANTYQPYNWEPIAEQFELFEDNIEIMPGIEMIKTGGHTSGLAAVKLIQDDEVLLHLSDIFQNTSSNNPLWVSANDDYPMDSIKLRFKWYREAFENGYKIIYYHDPYYAMVQFDETGENVIDYLEKDSPAVIEKGDFKPNTKNINRYSDSLVENLYKY